jgi:hypothetical protein
LFTISMINQRWFLIRSYHLRLRPLFVHQIIQQKFKPSTLILFLLKVNLFIFRWTSCLRLLRYLLCRETPKFQVASWILLILRHFLPISFDIVLTRLWSHAFQKIFILFTRFRAHFQRVKLLLEIITAFNFNKIVFSFFPIIILCV